MTAGGRPATPLQQRRCLTATPRSERGTSVPPIRRPMYVLTCRVHGSVARPLASLVDLLRSVTRSGLRMLTIFQCQRSRLDGADAVAIIDSTRQPFDGLNKRIARVATTYILSVCSKIIILATHFFFALDPGRPGFWKIQGDPFLGPWVSNLGPFFKSRVTLKKRYSGQQFFIYFYFF